MNSRQAKHTLGVTYPTLNSGLLEATVRLSRYRLSSLQFDSHNPNTFVVSKPSATLI